MIKPIPGYNGYSIIQETSQVLSHFKPIRDKSGKICDKVIDYNYSRPMKPQLVKEIGRSQIRPHLVLRQNNKRKKVFIHRLVALTYVNNPKPNEFNLVEHIDDNQSNYHYSNLKWSTHSVNMVTRSINQDKDLLIQELESKLTQYKQRYGEL